MIHIDHAPYQTKSNPSLTLFPNPNSKKYSKSLTGSLGETNAHPNHLVRQFKKIETWTWSWKINVFSIPQESFLLYLIKVEIYCIPCRAIKIGVNCTIHFLNEQILDVNYFVSGEVELMITLSCYSLYVPPQTTKPYLIVINHVFC